MWTVWKVYCRDCGFCYLLWKSVYICLINWLKLNSKLCLLWGGNNQCSYFSFQVLYSSFFSSQPILLAESICRFLLSLPLLLPPFQDRSNLLSLSAELMSPAGLSGDKWRANESSSCHCETEIHSIYRLSIHSHRLKTETLYKDS